ncbi:hypothetical protein [Holospora curviuscula]|uniref:Uncharacterized protein n=1 Tax=Holospora curviuscula TaxID=1082868 RepID=A0A2S5R988_9PROT|nr:hypothetical protein [Holospora curviuscula]PPE03853.1 hypothetical protein HCUR_00630 [Holospora curviuscula]
MTDYQGFRYLEFAALVDQNLQGQKILESLKSKPAPLHGLQALHKINPDLVPSNALFYPYIIPQDLRIQRFLNTLKRNDECGLSTQSTLKLEQSFQAQKAK